MNTKIIFIALLSSMLLQACTEFLSPDVSKLELPINSPKDSLYSPQAEISFWWEADNLVEKYQFQLVSPDFDQPFLLMDTLMNENAFYLTLAEGQYSWRLQAKNEGSSSPFVTRSLIVDLTSPLTGRALSPLSGDSLDASSSVMLTWHSQDQPINGISHPVSDSIYLYEMINGRNFLLGSYFREIGEMKSISISSDLPAPAEPTPYYWQVKTFDQAGNRSESEMFEFHLK